MTQQTQNIEEQLEEVVSKDKEKLKDDFDKWFFSTNARFNKRDEMNDIADWWLSKMYPVGIADEVLKVMVEIINQVPTEFPQYESDDMDVGAKKFKTILLSNLSPNKENKNNGNE